MTPTQLKGLNTKQLVDYARRFVKPGHEETHRGALIHELADRLDDAYPFVSTPQPDPDQQELPA